MKRRLIIFFTAAFVLLVLGDLLLGKERAGLLGFHFPGMFSIFGLVACVIIIVASKWLGHYWLQKREDYYRKKDDND